MKNLQLRLHKNNGEIKEYRSKTFINRIMRRISHAQFKKAYVRVSYGKRLCNKKCVCEFYNDGWYDNPKDLKQAASIFWNEV